MNSNLYTKSSALTIDVEDGVNIIMRDHFKKEMPPTKRVVQNVQRLLELFGEKEVKATFFILGEIAEHYPRLIKDIASKGHELGVHGYYHDQIFKLTPDSAFNNIKRAKTLIEDISGVKVAGFRAPAFSVSENTSWVFEVLAELDFIYDSSVVPVKAGRYGWPGFNKDIQKLQLKNDRTIIEVPMSVTKFLWKTLPACGGGYLRYFPYFVTNYAFSKIQKKRSPILYLHPYEIDTGKYPGYFYEAKSALPLNKRISLSLYRLNKGTVYEKLSRLLDNFTFMPLSNIINIYKENIKIRAI